MEFLRFGSSIPGSYWGCCACDIIQNFKVDPDEKASIQMVGGDSSTACGDQFAGPTYKDIFFQRIRVGTFGTRDMPNHAFIAILTQSQLMSNPGKKWIPILKEAGFEFVRSVSNSVYAGATTVKPGTFSNSSVNHIFMLVRNIGNGAVINPYLPPKEWLDVPGGVTESSSLFDLEKMKDFPKLQQEEQLQRWEKIGPAKFLTEKQVLDAGAVVTYAGIRSGNGSSPEPVTSGFTGARPETKENRLLRQKQQQTMLRLWNEAGRPLDGDKANPFGKEAKKKEPVAAPALAQALEA